MNRRRTLFILPLAAITLAVSFTPALAAINEIVWKRFSSDGIFKTAVDGNGNVIVTGELSDDTALIHKLSGGGRVLWTRQLEPGRESVGDVAVDSDGNIYVEGSTRIEGEYRAFISKYGPRGGHHWTRTITEALLRKVEVGPGGSIYVFGFAYGPLPNMPLRVNGFSNSFIRKYNPNGKIYWTRFISANQFTGNTEAFDFAIGPGGGVYVTGQDDSVYSSNVRGLEPNEPLFLSKYSPRGGLYWTKHVQRKEPYAVHSADIVVDRRGEVTIVAGAMNLASPGEAYAGDLRTKAVAVKYTHKGKRIWTRVTAGLWPTSLAVDGDRSIYIVGWRDSVNGKRAFTSKYQANGSLMWTRYFASGVAYDAAADSANNVYVTGKRMSQNDPSFLVKFRK